MVLESFQENLSLEDFSVIAKGFGKNITENEAKNYFSQYGAINELYLARKYFGKLNIHKKRFKLSNQLTTKIRTNYRKKSIVQIKQSITQFDNKDSLDFFHHELPVERVFVVFENAESKSHCLKTELQLKKRCCFKSNYVSNHNASRFTLNIKSAPDPTNVL